MATNFKNTTLDDLPKSQVGTVGAFGGNLELGFGNDIGAGLTVGSLAYVFNGKLLPFTTDDFDEGEIAIGIVEYQLDYSIEGEGVISLEKNDANVQVLREGLITMALKDGQSPSIGTQVYFSTAEATFGQLQTTSGGGATLGNSTFERKLGDNWIVHIKDLHKSV